MSGHNRSERQIYCRHQVGCLNFKKSNRRSIFGCGCSVNGRLTVVHPHTNEILFKFKEGSLRKYGVTTKQGAEDLFHVWTHDALTGKSKTPEVMTRESKTVSEAVAYVLDEITLSAKGRIREWHVGTKGEAGGDPEKAVHPSTKKYKVLLKKLVKFCDARNVTLLRSIDTPLLFEFVKSWPGRKKKITNADGSWEFEKLRDKEGHPVKDSDDDFVFATEPKSTVAIQKEQELLKWVFRRWEALKFIAENPARHLPTISVIQPTAKPFQMDQREDIEAAIHNLYKDDPEELKKVLAFHLLQRYGGVAIGDVATSETKRLDNDGIDLFRKKTGTYVYAELHGEAARAITALRNIKPASENYFFWTGKSTLKTLVTHWTEKMKNVFKEAGIPENQRSHEWRDTLAMDMLENGAKLEDVQLTLGHQRISTTQKYVKTSKARFEQANKIKRQMWGANKNENKTESTSANQSMMEELATVPPEKLRLLIQLLKS